MIIPNLFEKGKKTKIKIFQLTNLIGMLNLGN